MKVTIIVIRLGTISEEYGKLTRRAEDLRKTKEHPYISTEKKINCGT